MYKPGGASAIYPDKFEEFVGHIPEDERGDLVEAYRKRLTSDDPAVQLAAAQAWSKWEGDIVTLAARVPTRSRISPSPRSRSRSPGSRTITWPTAAGSKSGSF